MNIRPKTYADVRQEVHQIIRDVACHGPEAPVADDAPLGRGAGFQGNSLAGALGLDAIDHVEIHLACETFFHIRISDADCNRINTARELVDHVARLLGITATEAA